MPDYSSNVMMESEEGLIHLSALKKEVRSKKCENLSNTLVTKKSVHQVVCLKKTCKRIIFLKKANKQIKISSILALLALTQHTQHYVCMFPICTHTGNLCKVFRCSHPKLFYAYVHILVVEYAKWIMIIRGVNWVTTRFCLDDS